MKKVITVFLSVFLFVSLIGGSQALAMTSFKDVGDNYWANAEIDFLINNNIINGYQDKTFRPEKPVTRADMAIMIVRALDLNTSNRPNPDFKDVKTTFYAYKEIAAVVDEGIFEKGKTFHPYVPMTRENVADALSKAFKLEKQANQSFKDVPASSESEKAILKLVAYDITTGYSNGTFRPKQKVTRAEFAVFMARALSEDFRPNQFHIPGNVNPVDILFRFATVNPEGAQDIFLPTNGFNIAEFAKNVKEFQLIEAHEVGRKNGEVEYSVTFTADLNKEYNGPLTEGENHLYFLIKRFGYMEFKIVSMGTGPHLLEEDSNRVTIEQVRSLIVKSQSIYWNVLSGGDGDRDDTVFSIKGKEYRYVGSSIGTMDKLRAYFQKAFTPEYTNNLIKQLGLIEYKGKVAQPNADGGSLLNWEKSTIKLIRETNKQKVYKVTVPVGDSKDKEELQAVLTFVPGQGWRVDELK